MMRRLVTAAAAVTAALALTACSQDITQQRLERSLPVVFTHLYIQQQADIGRPGLTAARTAPQHVSCDKGGPAEKNVGAGNDWICFMDFTNGAGQAQSQTKFEVKANSDGCYQVSSSSKVVGQLNIQAPGGHCLVNKVFEFDGCFDPTS